MKREKEMRRWEVGSREVDGDRMEEEGRREKG